MTATETYSLIGTVVGGGLLVWVLDWYRKRGKLIVQHPSLDVNSRKAKYDIGNFIRSLDLTLQLENTSGEKKSISHIELKFYNGEKYLDFYLSEHDVPPAETLDGHDIKNFKYRLLPYVANLDLPMLAIHDNTAFLEVSYKMKNNTNKIFIYGHAFHLIDVPDIDWNLQLPKS